MPSYIIRNGNFRDEVTRYSYPFDELSSLEDENVFIGTDLLIDASLYIKEAAELPLHISTVDGTYGEKDEVRLLISDKTGVEVGRVTLDYDTKEAEVIGTRGVPVGILVFNPVGLARFIGRVTGNIFKLMPSVASFLLDVSHVSEATHLRYVIVDGTAVSGDIRIIARHGCRFEVTDNGELRLDIVGDPHQTLSRQPVVSINGVKNRSIWLANHPRSNLRIDNSEGAIRFVQAGEAT
jgi:hypothetical protein